MKKIVLSGVMLIVFASCVSKQKYLDMVSKYEKQKSITKNTEAKYDDLQNDFNQFKKNYGSSG